MARHHVVLERHGVEMTRDLVALALRPRAAVVHGAPAHELRLVGVAERRALEIPMPGIDHPGARLLAEARAEPKAEVGAARAEGVVRRLTEGHLGRRTTPALILERGAIHPDHLVHAGDIAAFLRHREHRRALMRDDGLSVD